MKITRRQLRKLIRESLSIEFHKNPSVEEKELMIKAIMDMLNVENLK